MYIAAAGMACSVGLFAEAACAAIRVGITGFEELAYVDDDGETIIGAWVPTLEQSLHRQDRFLALLKLAIEDYMENSKTTQLERIPVLVALSEERPGGGANLSRSILAKMAEHTLLRPHPHLSQVFCQGHTAGFRALEQARRLLTQQQIPSCWVIGVDSYINASSLHWLHQNRRLKTEDNSDGVIPGEAAAAVLLTAKKPAKQAMKIAGLGFGHEEAILGSDRPLLGMGLTQAAQAALEDARLAIHEMNVRVTDVGGEGYSFKEQALMLSRLLRVRKETFPMWHLADSIGDVGAASGICQLIYLQEAFTKGYAPGPRAICCTSGTRGERAVAVVEYN